MVSSSGKPLIFMLKAGFRPAAPSTRPLPAQSNLLNEPAQRCLISEWHLFVRASTYACRQRLCLSLGLQ